MHVLHECVVEIDENFGPVNSKIIAIYIFTYTITKLQKVMNEAARLIIRTPRNEHISPVLKHLHCLPVKERIEFTAGVYLN